MTQWTASLQPLVIGALLLWAGAVKLRGLSPEKAKRNALGRIVGEQYASPAWRLVGGAELLIAAALLLPPALASEAGFAVAFSAGFLGYLGYARLASPDAACGCLSSRLERISWRTFARAGLVLIMAGYAYGFADSWWPESISGNPLGGIVLILAEAALLLGLSSEVDRYWLVPIRKLRVRLSHPLAGRSEHVPIEHTINQLQLSEPYRMLGASISSDVQDSWDEGEWRIVCYRIRQDHGQPATAVFAVPLRRYDPDAVRVAVVDESSDVPVGA
ncbi:MAG TPA: MauE/DoxX family redox-associated membrane protein [Micromonosporaceae bacterium]|jgi:hypothetical protein|nr:MauE/DoxX family redox-associated membrane protein [Micromonosporaceae bacterium]